MSTPNKRSERYLHVKEERIRDFVLAVRRLTTRAGAVGPVNTVDPADLAEVRKQLAIMENSLLKNSNYTVL